MANKWLMTALNYWVEIRKGRLWELYMKWRKSSTADWPKYKWLDNLKGKFSLHIIPNLLSFFFLVTWMQLWRACLASVSEERTCVCDKWGYQIILLRPRPVDQNQKGRVLLLLRLVVDSYLRWSDPTHSIVSLQELNSGRSAQKRAVRLKKGWRWGAVEAMPAKEES